MAWSPTPRVLLARAGRDETRCRERRQGYEWTGEVVETRDWTFRVIDRLME